MQSHARPLLIVLAILATGLAALKPIHIDEAANVYYARQIAEHPDDPYGFTMFWYQWPEPAQQVLTPPVLVYWWAPAVACFGERPMLWKVWLLPFVLLLVFSLHALFCRFAPGAEMALTWMTVLSPAFLPSLNLMPDIPALAGSLAAITLFLRVIATPENSERKALPSAMLAGVLTGLAMQTKYTAFVTPLVLLAAAIWQGKLRWGVLAVIVAVVVFSSWEWFTAWRYGQSHFLLHVSEQAEAAGASWTAKLLRKLGLVAPMFTILGGAASLLGVMGLAALGVRRRYLALTGAAALGSVAVVVFLDRRYPVDWVVPDWLGDGQKYHVEYSAALVYLGLLGLIPLGAAWGLSRQVWRSSSSGRFLAVWLLLELAGYFALTPFPAVRRVLPMLVVLTLLVGHVLCRNTRTDRLVPRMLTGSVIGLGLLFYVVDVCDARTSMVGAVSAAQEVERAGGGQVWYAGHWGFQYYAEQAGMRPIVPDQSRLQPGDWLVLPGTTIEQQRIRVSDRYSEWVMQIEVTDWLPWRTAVGYYGGPEPLERRTEPRLTVQVRRIIAEWVPTSVDHP
jgi:hypothetical protein